MTCIVGLKTEDGIIIAGDSALSNGDTVRKINGAKVFRRGQFVIGCCDSLRVLQLVNFKLNIPPLGKKELYKYMVTDFVDAMRKCFKMSGAARKENEEEEVSGVFVIGIKDRLFIVNADYAVEECNDGFAVVGSGEEYASGSLYSTIGDSDGEKRVILALETASYFCKSVSPPYTILKVKDGKKKRTAGSGGDPGAGVEEAKSGEESADSEGSSEGD